MKGVLTSSLRKGMCKVAALAAMVLGGQCSNDLKLPVGSIEAFDFRVFLLPFPVDKDFVPGLWTGNRNIVWRDTNDGPVLLVQLGGRNGERSGNV